jgi:D-beta-D-heptose 7-phosphate kinase/D-beta-D-heptose 1-phosphate adenosyltransferase
VASATVAGAGDTFISAFTLAALTGASPADAAQVAIAAAHVVVNKDNTAWCFLKELKYHFHLKEKYVAAIGDLEDLCDLYRFQGKRIVFTNGCFDILHSGHVTYLNQAKTLGDVLIVGVNRDESIRRLKGSERPINPLHDRLQVLAALGCVDHVIPFGEAHDDTPISLIACVKPQVFAKGGDYHNGMLPEASTVERYGGRIVFLQHVRDHSTTDIINRIHTVTHGAIHSS